MSSVLSIRTSVEEDIYQAVPLTHAVDSSAQSPDRIYAGLRSIWLLYEIA